MSLDQQDADADADAADHIPPYFIQDGVSLQHASESADQSSMHATVPSQLQGVNYSAASAPAFFLPVLEPAPIAASLNVADGTWKKNLDSTNLLMPAAYVSVASQTPPMESAESASISATQYCRILSLDQDIDNLSPYQCMVRKQIEFFEATEDYLQDTSQGRNRPIVLNQVGIRCRHCGTLPNKQRAKGAVFFPSQLDGLYQTAQNMANKHLLHDCCEIPANVREDLCHVRLKEKGLKTRKSAYGGGRHYWADGLRVLGVVQTADRRLMRTITPAVP
jgi:hypothetical protein